MRILSFVSLILLSTCSLAGQILVKYADVEGKELEYFLYEDNDMEIIVDSLDSLKTAFNLLDIQENSEDILISHTYDTTFVDTLYLFFKDVKTVLTIHNISGTNEKYVNLNEPTKLKQSELDYFSFDTISSKLGLLNGFENRIFKYQISGIVIDSRITSVLHNRKDIEELNIYARKMSLDKPLVLFQTKVNIYCDTLEFTVNGQIVTTPLPSTLNKDSKEGIDGLSGGDIKLMAKIILTDNNSKVRFITEGGQGSPAVKGHGKGDAKCEPAPFEATKTCHYMNHPYCSREGTRFYIRGDFLWNKPPNNKLPEAEKEIKAQFNGKPAKPGSKPGNGGRGGKITSNIQILKEIFKQYGGKAGQDAGKYIGGDPTSESVYIYYSVAEIRDRYYGRDRDMVEFGSPAQCKYLTTVFLEKGPDAFSPMGSYGEDGNFIKVNSIDISYLDYAITHEMNYIKDLYKNNNFELVYEKINELIERIDKYSNISKNINLKNDYFLLVNYKNQLENNLDFYGNPPGWAPMRSFGQIKTVFEKELDDAIKLLPIINVLRIKNLGDKNDIDKFKSLNEQSLIFARQSLKNIEEMVQSIESLDGEISRVNELNEYVNNKLRERERVLLEDLQNQEKNKKRKQKINKLCTIAQMLPYGQPYTAAIGKGIEMLNNNQLNSVEGILESSSQIKKAYSSGTEYRDLIKDFKTTVKGLNYNSAKDLKESIKNNGKQLDDMYNKIYENHIKQNMQSLKLSIPSDHLSSALQSMKDNDPIYNDLINEVDSLISLKTLTMVKINTLSSQIDNYMNEINLMSKIISEDAQKINSKIDVDQISYIDYLNKLESLIWDRIDKYYYFYIKAFEYFSLEQYIGQRDLFYVKQQTKEKMKQANVLDILKIDINLQCDKLFENGIYNYTPVVLKERTIRLDSIQVNKLFNSNNLIINLCDYESFQNANNIRIEDIVIPNLNNIFKGTKETNNLNAGSISFTFKHSGISEILVDEEKYLFNHYSHLTTKPIKYEVEYDIISEKASMVPIEYNLIITENKINNKEFMKEYFMPSGCSDISISINRKPQNIKEVINFNNFNIEFKLTYESKN